MYKNSQKGYNLIMQGGYITLVSVLIVGAVGLAITISILLFGLNSSRTSFALEQSIIAKNLANACAEEGLETIRENTTFVGTNTFYFENGNCTYEVINNGGSNRTINSSGLVADIVRRVQINIDALSPVNVVSWQEVAGF